MTAAGVALVVASCGPKGVEVAPVEGSVTLDGAPLPGGWVHLISDTGFGATANINRDGTFLVICQHGRGLPHGKYKVAVQLPTAADVADALPILKDKLREMVEATKGIKLPRKYGDLRTSDLVLDVVEGTNELKIAMQSK